MKKLVSLGLALVMCLALMIPAFATEQTFDTENSAMVPTVEVELPASGVVILNPYGMTYTGSVSGITANSTDQILSNIFALTNKTQNARLKVNMTVTAVVAGRTTLDTSTNETIQSSDTENSVIFKLKYGVDGNASAFSTTSSKSKVIRLNGEAQEQDPIILAANTSSGASNYVTFQFSGVANDHPETPWSESDTVGARFVFTFEPTTETVTSGF